MAERYEIRVRGHLSPAVADSFEGLEATHEPPETTLHGELTDEAALYAVLDRLQAFGLDLIEVRRLVGSREERPS